EIERVGGAETMIVNVRVISATNKDIDKLIRDGEFREDLFHRLNVFPVTLPPLRERKGDIPLLSMMILKKLRIKYDMPVNYIGYEALELLQNYDWPGNVRELENTLERCLIISNNKYLMKDDIESVLAEGTSHSIAQKEIVPLSLEPIPIPEVAPPTSTVNPITHLEIQTLKDLERIAIIQGLERTKWNLSLTAKQLGISRMTLYRKLELHGLKNTN
ncbi:MAG: sigma-54-dependent Fis family transcriptional regulator, partial [Candidatus Marinimicrobia bacterium]|nr:sigma-54-dependent Fis family transcriptional regulator [Candidatus Neomarinimicrobiota bacterium]MBT4000112.1 sigma-54-dependent Fis family transcriptional regulator [Candidatus Neomarinimicrobiota bacterium]